MIKHLQLQNVGPAPAMELEFGARLNLLTGDNGLGKSFLLDIIWWALTRKWPAELNHKLAAGSRAMPTDPQAPATIKFSFTGKTSVEDYTSTFQSKAQAWTGRTGRPSNPGLVFYAMPDGGFAVWDPARNYWRNTDLSDIQERLPAYVFGATEVWNGLNGNDGTPICNGLVLDWAGWQKEKGEPIDILRGVLRDLSPSPEEVLVPGALKRISLDDSRDIPTIRMPYGQDVAVLHASAGIRRILALAYLLVWTWEEHKAAAEFLGEQTTNQIVFLVDEVESHLHPQWQRRIVPALLGVVKNLNANAEVQIIAATHSPLVMASIEPLFDADKDAWFDLDLAPDSGVEAKFAVELNRRTFLRQGDVSRWLTSDAFDLPSARSLEAEVALEEAALAMSEESFDPEEAKALTARLRGVLGDTDPFWMRWGFVAERRGWNVEQVADADMERDC